MNFRIRRRRFGQLAIASAAATALANLAGKSVAQSSPPAILGLRLSDIQTSTGIGKTIHDLTNTTPALNLVSLNLATGQELSILKIPVKTVDNLPQFSITIANLFANQAVSIEPRERLTGLVTLTDGRVVAASVVNTAQGDVSRLVITDSKSSTSQNSLIVSGLQSNSTVEDLLATKDNRLIAVVSLNRGTPPFALATIDPKTGAVNSGDDLGLPAVPPFLRLSNLAQSSDGTIYATTLGREGVTKLAQINLNKGNGSIINLSPLTLDSKPLENDLLSLAISPSGGLYALADPQSAGDNTLHTLDPNTGAVQPLRPFAVDQIAFPRS